MEKFIVSLKQLAYSAHQQLQTATGASFKRAHIYELLAAALGFKSYAAFVSQAVLTHQSTTDNPADTRSSFVVGRCLDLGYRPDVAAATSTALHSFLTERQIGVVTIAELVSRFRGDVPYRDDDSVSDSIEVSDDENDDELSSESADADQVGITQITLDGLESAASSGNALAHYALALIHAPDHGGDDEAAGSSYWHSQEKQGRVLVGVEKEWADAHAAHLARSEKYVRHLREAGRLGNQDALLDPAERDGDPSFFELPRDRIEADSSVVAGIAEQLGRQGDAKYWLTAAAEGGDTDAMLRLIEEHDQADLPRCWTWVYLSQHLGDDLAADDHYAIDEHGLEYDDEVGGPAYVAGREGIRLDPLTPEQDANARATARDLFERIQRSTSSIP
jgi:TPR repeat protein